MLRKYSEIIPPDLHRYYFKHTMGKITILGNNENSFFVKKLAINLIWIGAMTIGVSQFHKQPSMQLKGTVDTTEHYGLSSKIPPFHVLRVV